MTEDEITRTKVEISRSISERLEQAFVGQSVADVSTWMVKGFIENTLKDLIARGRLLDEAVPVVDLIDYDIVMDGKVMKISSKPKSGLSDEDYQRARDFLFNWGSDSAR